MRKVFDRKGGEEWDLVFNCGGETRYSQEDEVYRTRSYDLSLAIGKEAAKRKVGCFIECSTGQVYKPNEAPRKETDSTKPWSRLAKWKLAAEEALAQVDGLNLIVLRFANIYGPYTQGFLSTGLCMARVYQELDTEMKWLWDKGLMTNTVHVVDAARSLWTAATWYRDTGQKIKKGKALVFNIVDHGKTCMTVIATRSLPKSDLLNNVCRSGYNRRSISFGFQHSHRVPRHIGVVFRTVEPGQCRRGRK